MIDMIGDNELPPGDRAERPDPPEASAPSEIPGRVLDRYLHEQIKAKLTPDFSQAELARQLGVSAAALNKWIKGKPVGDVEKLEFKLQAWLNGAMERIDLTRELRHTPVTQEVCAIIRSIIKTNDLGIVTGRAGIGKTCGAQLFLLEDPMATLLTADYCHGSAECMVSDLRRKNSIRRRKIDPMGFNDIVVERFTGTNRPLMIDNAHALTMGGLRWAYAFHNRTGCPVVLIGNPLIEQKILALPDEDQFTTRTGQFQAVGVFDNKSAKELASLLLDQYAPHLKADLLAQATDICRARGYARRLKKQIRVALGILEGGLSDKTVIKDLRAQGFTDAQIAFNLAATQLLTLKGGEL